MQCDRCKGQAVLFQKYSGKHLCRRHFIADFEAKAKKVIRSSHWLRPHDHLGVALSGTAGSNALLYFLKHLTGNRHDIRITAITICGEKGVSGDHLRAKQVAGSLGVNWICRTYQNTLMNGMDHGYEDKSGFLTCTFSHILVRCLLRTLGREYGITRIAFGTTLDDRAASVLRMMLSGNGERLINLECNERDSIPIITPFIASSEYEVNLYAKLHDFGSDSTDCSPIRDSLQEDIVSLLSRYTSDHPATKYALVNLSNAVRIAAGTAHVSLPPCGQCAKICLQTAASYRFYETEVSDAT